MWNPFRQKCTNKQKNDRQKGALTVEAVVSFVGFLFVIFTILNVVNFCRAQVLISNAVDTVTKELTQYSYLYQISGLQKFDSDVQDIAQTGKDNLNRVAGSVGDLYCAMSTAVDNRSTEATNLANATLDGSVTEDMVTNALNNLKMDGTNINTAINNMTTEFATVADNPVLYMKSIIAVAGSEGLEAIKSHLIAAPLAKSLMVKHFGSDRATADANLEALGVVDGLDGMNFGMSTLFSADEKEDVHIVVYYKLKVVQLFPWADFEATMCKESHARAWLGGDDVVVKVAATKSDNGQAGGGEGGESPAEVPEETPEEEEPQDADAIKAAMVEKYGQETVDAVSDGEDTSNWTEEDWERRIWIYQNEETIENEIDKNIEENKDANSLTSEQIQFMLINVYGQNIVNQIKANFDTSNWTLNDWMAMIVYYQYMNQYTPDMYIRSQMINTYGVEVVNAVSAGMDTSSWTAEEWENRIGLYLQNLNAEDEKEEENESGKNSVDDIIKGVENGEIPLSNNIQKGNYGEMKMDVYFESQGYERISLDRVTDLNAPTHQGIDGVYYNPDGHPKYIIGEAKYGSSKLGSTLDGKQMSDNWVDKRLVDAVGEEMADDIVHEMMINPDNVQKQLVNISTDGNVITKILDEYANVVK